MFVHGKPFLPSLKFEQVRLEPACVKAPLGEAPGLAHKH
jgi:hypothetical protein